MQQFRAAFLTTPELPLHIRMFICLHPPACREFPAAFCPPRCSGFPIQHLSPTQPTKQHVRLIHSSLLSLCAGAPCVREAQRPSPCPKEKDSAVGTRARQSPRRFQEAPCPRTKTQQAGRNLLSPCCHFATTTLLQELPDASGLRKRLGVTAWHLGRQLTQKASAGGVQVGEGSGKGRGGEKTQQKGQDVPAIGVEGIAGPGVARGMAASGGLSGGGAVGSAPCAPTLPPPCPTQPAAAGPRQGEASELVELGANGVHDGAQLLLHLHRRVGVLPSNPLNLLAVVCHLALRKLEAVRCGQEGREWRGRVPTGECAGSEGWAH